MMGTMAAHGLYRLHHLRIARLWGRRHGRRRGRGGRCGGRSRLVANHSPVVNLVSVPAAKMSPLLHALHALLHLFSTFSCKLLLWIGECPEVLLLNGHIFGRISCFLLSGIWAWRVRWWDTHWANIWPLTETESGIPSRSLTMGPITILRRLFLLCVCVHIYVYIYIYIYIYYKCFSRLNWICCILNTFYCIILYHILLHYIISYYITLY